MKYRIEIDKKQARYIAHAVEMYSRMQGGQIELNFLKPLQEAIWNSKNYDYQRIVDNLLGVIKNLVYPDLGVGGNFHSEESDMGYDIYKSILEQFEKDRMEEEGDNYSSNVHTPPFRPFLSKPKPKVEKIGT